MPDYGRGRGTRGGSSSGSSRGGSASGRGGGAASRGRGGTASRGRGALNAEPQVFRHADGTPPVLDPAAGALESELVPISGNAAMNLSTLSINQDTPYRPGYGTRGEPVILWANYCQVLPKPDVAVFRYGVNVTPEVDNRRLRARIVHLFLADGPISALAPGVASDYQANVLTVRRLNADEMESSFLYRDQGEQTAAPDAKRYRLSLQLTGDFVLADLIDYVTSSNASAAFTDKPEIIQALNIVLNHLPKTKDPRTALSTKKNVHFTVTGPSAEGFDLGAGLQAWRGYVTSIRTAATRLLVNVQIKHVPMYKSVRLDEMMTEFIQQNGKDPYDMTRFLRRVRIDRLHLKRSNCSRPSQSKTITGLASPRDGRGLPYPPEVSHDGATAKNVRFFVDDNAPPPLQSNTYVTVFEYFKEVHKIAANATLPVINVGTSGKPMYLPPEVCFVIPAQPAVTKLSPNQTAEMIRFAVRRPFENAKSITGVGLSEIGLTSPNQVRNAFGLTVSPQMIAVQARILSTPTIRYAGNKSCITRFGSWNMGSFSFLKGATLDKWSVLWLQCRSTPDPWNNNPPRFVSTLNDFHRTLKDCGLKCASPQVPGKNIQVDTDDDEGSIEGGFKELLSRNRKETLLLVILPRRDDRLYNLIKICGDIKFGIHTVCVVGKKFAKPNNVQYFANVALKFNLKLGGINHSLDPNKLGFIAQGKTMVVGIDVTHPSPGSDKSAPSVTAMVASIDRTLGQFPAVLHSQSGYQEMVDDLNIMLKSRLSLWQKHNQKRLPENILVYRDGVSDGQYYTVLRKELPLLQQACREVYPAKGKKPAISIIIAGKRHSTRFYPTSTERDKIDERSSNPKHGTVVDRGITEPRYWDFFLQAHTALQGTARPAHYFVVHDEIFTRMPVPYGFAHAGDVLEDITHNMCYMFGRATKAVSYCPPAYYADKACERARCYLSNLFSPTASQTASISRGSTTSGGIQQSLDLHDSIKDTMFYI